MSTTVRKDYGITVRDVFDIITEEMAKKGFKDYIENYTERWGKRIMRSKITEFLLLPEHEDHGRIRVTFNGEESKVKVTSKSPEFTEAAMAIDKAILERLDCKREFHVLIVNEFDEK